MGDAVDAKVDDPEIKHAESSTGINGYNGVTDSDNGYKMSDTSRAILDESRALLDCKSSVAATFSPGPLHTSRTPSPEREHYTNPSTTRRLTTPRFPRIDFDQKVINDIEDKQPAWKQWQESVKDSYYKAKRTVERNKDEADFLESTVNKPVARRGLSPFRELETNGFIPARNYGGPSSYLSPSSSSSNIFKGSGPYAAPSVNRSQGIESRYVRDPISSYEKAYDKRISDIESRLIKTSVLPNIRSITAKEFRSAPNPSAGSSSDQNDLDDYDFSRYAPRTYYSRPNRDDPDYFDFDLQHSVDLYKRPEGKFTPRGSKPQEWESKLLMEHREKGSVPLSGYLFSKGDSDWRQNNSSYLSAALRTPKFWEQRFQAIGSQVRESNPISLDSINRRRRELSIDRLERQLPPSARMCSSYSDVGLLNKPVTSRFTEYRDPDFEDYDDPRADD